MKLSNTFETKVAERLTTWNYTVLCSTLHNHKEKMYDYLDETDSPIYKMSKLYVDLITKELKKEYRK